MKKLKAFTLIELLITIAVISILAGVGFSQFKTMRERARDTQRISDLEHIASAIKTYAVDNDHYPAITGEEIHSIDSITKSLSRYMREIPTDPSGDGIIEKDGECSEGGTSYAYYADKGEYAVTTLLEIGTGNTMKCKGIIENNVPSHYKTLGAKKGTVGNQYTMLEKKKKLKRTGECKQYTQALKTQPVSDLCEYGNASPITGDGPRHRTCKASGGISPTCTAEKRSNPIPGVCGTKKDTCTTIRGGNPGKDEYSRTCNGSEQGHQTQCHIYIFKDPNNDITMKATQYAQGGKEYQFEGKTYYVVQHKAELYDKIRQGHWATEKIITSKVKDMNKLFKSSSFNQDISNRDVSNVTDMSYMFYRAESFNQNINNRDVSNVKNMEGMLAYASSFDKPIDKRNVSNVKNMKGMFWGAQKFNQDINGRNVSNVKNMQGMLGYNQKFNQDIGDRDVSNVTDTSWMFSSTQKFNQPIGKRKRKVSNVTNMEGMFEDAKKFNQDIGDRDVSNVKNMKGMFKNAEKFNQDISDRNVSNVTDTSWMFQGTKEFNQDIGDRDVSNVKNMKGMFKNAEKFNQDISDRNVSNVTDTSWMFQGTKEFDQDISSRDVSNATNAIAMFGIAKKFHKDLSRRCFKKIVKPSNSSITRTREPLNYKDSRLPHRGADCSKQSTIY